MHSSAARPFTQETKQRMTNVQRSLLSSPLPTERARAIELLRREGTAEDVEAIREQLQNESVDGLRRQLVKLIVQLSSRTSPQGQSADDEAAQLTNNAIEQDSHIAITWLRHELEPAIGSLRVVANREVPNFQHSETNQVIEGLRDRLDSVEALLRFDLPLRVEPVSLRELVDQVVARTPRGQQIVMSDFVDDDTNDDIETDVRLTRLIVNTSLTNAMEAVALLEEDRQVVNVAGGVTPNEFWLRISNPFEGTRFLQEEVSPRGRSGKEGHGGQGFSMMNRAADKLSYSLELVADGGFATFTVKGARSRG